MALTANSNLANSTAESSNPLDQFQTFNNIFTLAGCKRGQINGNIDKSSIKNVICRSYSVGESGVETGFGSFDYFIDDVTIVTMPAITKKTGNSFATKFTFKVFEPYSMGLFMLATRKAAADAGYNLNYKEAPYIFMIEWAGYIDGQPAESAESNLTRIIPIKFINITFKVGQTGSIYECEAIPYNEHAFREQIVKHVTDVQISGATVKEILAEGPTSFLNQLKTKFENEKAAQHITDSDEILIQFPKDYMQFYGSNNDISDAKLYIDLNNAGVQPFSALPDIFDDKHHIFKSGPFKLDPKRVWCFAQEITIPDLITEVIIRSDYVTRQIIDGQFRPDANGMVNWFRIEPRVLDRNDNAQMGRQKRLIVYRVIPYKVHIHRFLPPNTSPPGGYRNLQNTVARVYNYIYTGKNTEILNLELNFDMAFFTPVPADSGANVGASNSGQKGITAGGKEVVNVFPEGSNTGPGTPGGASATNTNTSGYTASSRQLSGSQNSNSDSGNSGELVGVSVPAAQRQFQSKTIGGDGTDNEKTSKVRTMQYLLTNSVDMINLNMEIMGDPYYIMTSGMGSQTVDRKGPNELKDGSMNNQDSEVHIVINFRTPIDFDPVSGLYKFQQGIDMWSGLYQVTEVESRFNQNKFTQYVRGLRLRSQLGGQDAQSIFLTENPQARSKGTQGSGGSSDPYSAGLLNPDTGGGGYEGGAGPQGGGSGNTSSPTAQPTFNQPNRPVPNVQPSPNINYDFGRNIPIPK